MVRAIVVSVLIALSGCTLIPRIDPPQALHEGDFLVHVVTRKEETLAQILTWYTGSALSEPLVVQHNPFLANRGVQLGDRIRIPLEIVANDRRYATDASQEEPRTIAPNLLMEGEGKRPVETSIKMGGSDGRRPGHSLETFNDETNPDKSETTSLSTNGDADRVNHLEQEIREKQRELEELKQRAPLERFDDEDMPPLIPPEAVEGS